MTTAKNEVFIGLYHENYYLVGGNSPLVGRKSIMGNCSRWRGNEQILGWWGDLPSSPQ